jgi:uncharacterized membrane protein YcaP (DUF421 family)
MSNAVGKLLGTLGSVFCTQMLEKTLEIMQVVVVLLVWLVVFWLEPFLVYCTALIPAFKNR